MTVAGITHKVQVAPCATAAEALSVVMGSETARWLDVLAGDEDFCNGIVGSYGNAVAGQTLITAPYGVAFSVTDEYQADKRLRRDLLNLPADVIEAGFECWRVVDAETGAVSTCIGAQLFPDTLDLVAAC